MGRFLIPNPTGCLVILSHSKVPHCKYRYDPHLATGRRVPTLFALEGDPINNVVNRLHNGGIMMW